MKKLYVISIALVVCLAVPLMAQEKEMAKKDMPEMPAPPDPIDDEFINWLIGEWTGWSEGPMGKAEVSVNCSKAFGDQFMLVEYKSKSAMGDFTGGGVYTTNDEGGIEAFWVDSMREMAKGKGKRDGDVMTMNWEGKMGKGTRVTTKVSDDKYVVTSKFEMPDGTVMEGKEEMTRVKEMTEKN